MEKILPAYQNNCQILRTKASLTLNLLKIQNQSARFFSVERVV